MNLDIFPEPFLELEKNLLKSTRKILLGIKHSLGAQYDGKGQNEKIVRSNEMMGRGKMKNCKSNENIWKGRNENIWKECNEGLEERNEGLE
ncbi:14098_t:CDS:2 [Racocetra persica]|uniref:14098_t:CDS:1 n=1 Tax=Racocetra persica TaxID=160502 RepID=A0ACA9M9X5_9GLOM|nr:14098_t:CDS:2 [Racocetra persica]